MKITAEYRSVTETLTKLRDRIRQGKIRLADLEEALIEDLLEVAFISDRALRDTYLSEYMRLKTQGDTDREVLYLDDIIAHITALGGQQLNREREINAMQSAQASVLPEELRGLEESPSEYRRLDPARIFLAQNSGGRELSYQRLDIIIKYLAIENYYHKNDYGFALYQKLQCLRRKQSGGLPRDYENMCVKVFAMLISSIEKEHFKEASYITCDEDLALIDGAHRLAACLYFDIRKINARLLGLKVCMSAPFTMDYLKAGGFTEEELAVISGKTKELMEHYQKEADTGRIVL